MYGKEIVEKPDWLNINVFGQNKEELLFEEKVKIQKEVKIPAQKTIFAEDEAFKDFSQLINRKDVGDDLREEIKNLISKYKNWNKL